MLSIAFFIVVLSEIMLSVVMLSVVTRYAECHYAECLNVESHCTECCYAQCLYAECHYAECRGADYLVVGIVYDKSGVPPVLIRQLVTNKPLPPSDASGNKLECFLLTNGFVGQCWTAQLIANLVVGEVKLNHTSVTAGIFNNCKESFSA